MNTLNITDLKEKNLIAYEYVRGSQLYNLALDNNKSDIDIGGVFISPVNTILGLPKFYQDQVSDEKHDTTYYEIGRWLELLFQSNPNALESLYIPKDKIIGDVHPAIQLVIDCRDKFLTKKCFAPFYGYAVQQIKRARGLNKKIVNPVYERKSVLDFCYTFKNQGSTKIEDWLKNYGLKQEYCGLVCVANMRDMYGVYYDWGAHKQFLIETNASDAQKLNLVYTGEKLNAWPEPLNPWFAWDNIHPLLGYKGIIKKENKETNTKESNEVRLSSVEKNVLPICYLSYNKDGYVKHCKDYREYKEWEHNRNPVRYESNLNKNYDCYLDDETEFLTNNGWKKYDDITENDLLGCFNDDHCIEYKPYLSRTDDIYSGKIYTYESPYIRCSITPNHKLYISPCHRNTNNGFSIKYDKNKSDWKLIPVAEYFKGKRSFYHQLNCLSNKQNDNKLFTDDFIKLLGIFLSEGTFVYKKDSIYPHSIRMSQIEGGKCCDIIRSIKSINIKEYHYNNRGKGDEITWECTDNTIISLLIECNGRYCNEKDIPLYVNTFSKRQFDILLESMLAGDGTYHKVKGHKVYYTYSKKMAKSLHTLLMMNGYCAQFYGGNDGYKYNYESQYKRKDGIVNGGYQVFISKFNKQYHVLNKNSHWSISNVNNKRIVCFETEYGTLVTRNNNKLCFHGNSKNICHTIRLMHMAYEIATGQGFNVVRTWDRDFLMKVRQHQFEYDYIIDYVEDFKVKMEEAMAKSTLPEEIDENFVNDLLIDIRRLCLNNEY